MKIAHLVLSNVYAGIEQHVNELISLQERECEVILICNTEIKGKFDCSKIIAEMWCSCRFYTCERDFFIQNNT